MDNIHNVLKSLILHFSSSVNFTFRGISHDRLKTITFLTIKCNFSFYIQEDLKKVIENKT
jgi:hypothetical protein